MFIYFRNFLNYLQPELSDAKGINIRNAFLGCIYTRVSFFRDICAKNACTKNVYIRNVSIKSIDSNDICIISNYIIRFDTKAIYVENIFAKNTSLIK